MIVDTVTLRGCSPTAAFAAAAPLLAEVGEERVSLEHAIGRVLSRPLLADRDHPAADISAMDGFAVRTADLATGAPRIVGSIVAGSPQITLTPQTAVSIPTGAVVPAGADAVVRSEWCLHDSDHLKLDPGRTIKPGCDIRRRGENCRSGDILADAGQPLNAATIAAAAAFGHASLWVRRSLQVTLIVTGDELVRPSESVKPHQVRESNGVSIQSLLACKPWVSAKIVIRCPDTHRKTAQAISAAAASSDAVFVTGGTCRGAHDFVRPALRSAGAKILFDGLAIRPGRPTIGAIVGKSALVLALPGNPVAALIVARILGLPLLQKMGGYHEQNGAIRVAVESNVATHPGIERFELARVTDAGDVMIIPSRGSADIPAAAGSDGVIALDSAHLHSGLFYRW